MLKALAACGASIEAPVNEDDIADDVRACWIVSARASCTVERRRDSSRSSLGTRLAPLLRCMRTARARWARVRG